MRRVVLVTGPPCAGKTTYVQQHAADGDLILDQDAIGQRRMNQALAQVAAMPDGTAWVIRCAPGRRVRQHLAQQVGATEHVHLVEPEPTLVMRAARRTHPRRHIAAVAAWFKRERENPAPPQRRAPATKGSTNERDYGYAHQVARANAIRDMHDGQACARCGRPMWRSDAGRLDLDHTDERDGYRGLAHRGCNRRAGQAKSVANRRSNQTSVTTRNRSRNW